jgi:hypothetical protein
MQHLSNDGSFLARFVRFVWRQRTGRRRRPDQQLAVLDEELISRISERVDQRERLLPLLARLDLGERVVQPPQRLGVAGEVGVGVRRELLRHALESGDDGTSGVREGFQRRGRRPALACRELAVLLVECAEQLHGASVRIDPSEPSQQIVRPL